MAICPINTESWKGRRRIAGDLALRGDVAAARRALCVLTQDAESIEDRAAVLSDLAAVSAASGRIIAADRGFNDKSSARRKFLSRREFTESGQVGLMSSV